MILHALLFEHPAASGCLEELREGDLLGVLEQVVRGTDPVYHLQSTQKLKAILANPAIRCFLIHYFAL